MTPSKHAKGTLYNSNPLLIKKFPTLFIFNQYWKFSQVKLELFKNKNEINNNQRKNINIGLEQYDLNILQGRI